MNMRSYSSILITMLLALANTTPVLAQESHETSGDETDREVTVNKHHHYKLIDMGTFGGPSSYFVAPENSRPIVNSRGTVVGGSILATPVSALSNPFVCGGIAGQVLNLNHAFKWNGAVHDLGALAPEETNCSVATSINAKGDVGGISENGIVDPVLGWNEIRAVLWRGDKILDLGTFGGTLSIAGPINNKGQIIGEALNDVPDPYSLFDLLIFGSSTGTQTRAFLWQDGAMQDLGTLGGPDAAAGFGWGFINERGQITGISYTNSTPAPSTGFPTLDPFVWENGKMKDLGSLGGVVGFPVDINNRGQVIGGSSTAATPGACWVTGTSSLEFSSPDCHPFLWDKGKMIDLYTSTVGGIPMTVDAINDAGAIIGAGAFPNDPSDGYLWKEGVAIDVGNLGDCASEAFDINSRGQVAAGTFLCDGTHYRAFLWENGSAIDLNATIPSGSSLHLNWAMAINDAAEIGGLGVPQGCPSSDLVICGHAFLLVPCDEGHPNLEGCDYSLVDAAPAAQRPVEANQSHQIPKALFQRLGTRRFGIR